MINKADATVTVNGYTGTYDAAPHGATGTATGVGGVDLSAGLNLGATFTDVPGGTAHWTFTGGTTHTATGSVTGVLGESLAGLDLSGTTHTNASNYTDTWMFTDVTGNYNNDSGTVNDVIGKANATVVVTTYNVTMTLIRTQRPTRSLE